MKKITEPLSNRNRNIYRVNIFNSDLPRSATRLVKFLCKRLNFKNSQQQSQHSSILHESNTGLLVNNDLTTAKVLQFENGYCYFC